MSLKEKLQEDWKQALISIAKVAILLVEKNDGRLLADEEIYEVISKEVKQRCEAILEFEKGNMQDLDDKANAEMEILLSYLPQQLSEEEICEIVRQAVSKWDLVA
jgi:uncharacterized protein YqeY